MYSIFDIFKVSIGPSSSHTMGPMIAAKHFRDLLINKSIDSEVNKINAVLFGSLAYTGKAHGSEKGVVLGLEGYSPETIKANEIKSTITKVKRTKSISLARNILRAETAAIAAATIVSYKLNFSY